MKDFDNIYILDSHCDTPSMLIEGIDLSVRNTHSHVDIPRLREGGVDALFFSIYTPVTYFGNQATEYAINLISKSYMAISDNCEDLALARTASDAYENKKNGKISVFLGMENGTPIQEDFSFLHLFNDFGIRYLTLCHNADNQICDSAVGTHGTWGGLSPFGKRLLEELNSLGILADCSHASDATFYDMLKYSKAPIIASHSSCRKLCNHPRNLTDQMIRDLSSEGGLVQINFYPRFIDESFAIENQRYRKLSDYMEKWQAIYREDLYNDIAKDNYFSAIEELKTIKTPGISKVVDHIDRAVILAGYESVGLGSDFDGIDVAPRGLEDISSYSKIASELKSRGYSTTHIEAIMGGNLLRVLDEAARLASFLRS